ncbi:Transposase [Rhizobiales bacterium GAS191]|nr:Transposase [Rhizobiales bacterium GAS191]
MPNGILAPLLPPPGKTSRPRRRPMREIMNAIFYVLRSGCPWRMLPDCFAPATTIYRWFTRLREDGVLETINHHLLMCDRERVGRQASPSGVVIDSQCVKTTEAGGPRGYDAGKKINGRKRHAMVDTDGRALVLQVHPASIQDRDGAVPLLRHSAPPSPSPSMLSPTAPMRPSASPRQPASSPRLSASIQIRLASPSIHGAKSSRGSLPGSSETAALRRTSKQPSLPLKHSSMPPPSCS